jgi:1-carboxybiuret hydrolase subunit AtzH-like protein
MSATPEVDDPQALAELTAAFEAYERALVGNDIAALNDMFWDSPLTLRYGTRAHELLYGHAAIAEFRRKRGAVDQRRTLRNTRIVTFGADVGVANTEYVPAGSDRIGRQSQTWMRTAQGWKIVCAHVSFGL